MLSGYEDHVKSIIGEGTGTRNRRTVVGKEVRSKPPEFQCCDWFRQPFANLVLLAAQLSPSLSARPSSRKSCRHLCISSKSF